MIIVHPTPSVDSPDDVSLGPSPPGLSSGTGEAFVGNWRRRAASRRALRVDDMLERMCVVVVVVDSGLEYRDKLRKTSFNLY